MLEVQVVKYRGCPPCDKKAKYSFPNRGAFEDYFQRNFEKVITGNDTLMVYDCV
ncbi:hypothetical protein DPMN_167522 [Dreissena polymorpha]|uniref:Uncharacterized protein n=1 Tax=Dreissena polymorpha TaxID=45954 RepID=A0A9D4F4P1_DREPO|nr:hypothetical protein DPMN_167522 [Dreissena polymorpha]